MSIRINWKLIKKEGERPFYMTYHERDMVIEAFNRLVDVINDLSDELDEAKNEILKLKDNTN